MAERTGEMTVTFEARLRLAECVRRLGLLGNPIIRTAGRRFTVTVPDGTQFEWAHRYGNLLGVQRVHYDRPLASAAPN